MFFVKPIQKRQSIFQVFKFQSLLTCLHLIYVLPVFLRVGFFDSSVALRTDFNFHKITLQQLVSTQVSQLNICKQCHDKRNNYHKNLIGKKSIHNTTFIAFIILSQQSNQNTYTMHTKKNELNVYALVLLIKTESKYLNYYSQHRKHFDNEITF